MTDQHRADCLGCEGHPALLTPNLDAIAGNGARMAHCYSTCPPCVPGAGPCFQDSSPQHTAWWTARNAKQAGVDWQFTAANARIKLKRLYPKMTA